MADPTQRITISEIATDLQAATVAPHAPLPGKLPQEQLSGRDLYGLPSRVPAPTPEQAACTHTKGCWVTTVVPLDWDNDEETTEWREEDTMEDIPDTHLLRCTQCGYVRRY